MLFRPQPVSKHASALSYIWEIKSYEQLSEMNLTSWKPRWEVEVICFDKSST